MPARIEIRRLHPGATLPSRMTAGAAGFDLHACLPDGPVELGPGERRLIPTGLQLALPVGHEGQVRPRSGLALRQGITVLNAPGTIDADYRGELGVLLVHLGHETASITHGDRIAQLVLARVADAEILEVDAVSETPRGAGGFGSTGV